jgi:acetyl esterase
MATPFVRPDVRAFLDRLKANPRPQMTHDSIAAMRPHAPRGMALLEPPVGVLAITRDVAAPGLAGAIPIRLFDTQVERKPGPALVFFHGGGFVIGNIDTHVSMCAELARRLDLPVLSVDYRLAPEHPWPAAPDDAETATRWIAENGAAFNRNITSLVLCGDSAGGTLTLITALALRNRPAAVPVIFQLALYPRADADNERQQRYPSAVAFSDGYGLDAADMTFFNQAYNANPTHWRGSPLLNDLAGMPPLLMVTAALDPLRDQGRAYAAKAIEAGVFTTYLEIPGTIHGFAGYRQAIPSAQQDFVDILEIAAHMLRAQDTATGAYLADMGPDTASGAT